MVATAYPRDPRSLRNNEYTPISAHYSVFNFCSTEGILLPPHVWIYRKPRVHLDMANALL